MLREVVAGAPRAAPGTAAVDPPWLLEAKADLRRLMRDRDR
jgi:hypothetical protein